MTRLLTLVVGVLGVVLPNVGSWGLPVAVQGIITAVGGSLLAALAVLEHPTTKTAASSAPVKGQ
jgi:hypothetical protein